MSRFRAFVRTRRLLAFFALACVLTWAPVPWRSYFPTGALIAALAVADAARAAVLNLVLWCAFAVILLVAYRRFWTSPVTSRCIRQG
ncbi:hypothetical protein [Jidongwangia harbinensis]|uniref:hypothetical protein n=1 Tax=Jidongwangia harbinensis TaxID=2878561 RepID=UPI001CDA4FDB|nr:hypothetical protein [Jidongwangia harbinensis]MCA2211803.1 hypothetical protein [Jidongwangia harbinensis]